jgi:hypothetical protein
MTPRNAGERCAQGRPEPYLAWFGPLGVVIAGIGLATGIGRWPVSLTALDDLVPGVPGWVVVVVLLCATPFLSLLFWGEDLGWNSYLRLRLWVGGRRRRRGAAPPRRSPGTATTGRAGRGRGRRGRPAAGPGRRRR